MSPRSVGRTVLQRVWMPLVAVVAVAVGLVCMWKVHEFSAPRPSSLSMARKHLDVHSQTAHV